jgi:hypothetical protein
MTFYHWLAAVLLVYGSYRVIEAAWAADKRDEERERLVSQKGRAA